MAKTDTKLRILESAEQLFATHGFTHTSLRQITTEANVNLASVNYHFGSKKSLIQSVLKRYLEIYMPLLHQNLNQIAPQKNEIEPVLQAFIKPLFELNKLGKQSPRNFMIMIGRGYSETQGHLRKYIVSEYGETVLLITHKFANALPNISAQELFWRLHFALGALVFVMSSSSALEEIAEADYAESATTEKIVNKIVPFLAAGLSCKSQ
ncbi:TetR/AcrR family transcriptional regulator [Catenovulum sediminis]|uniref:TetR/AcrR family transcriptional regulator n=1 Tax=Catenovulum sediminis TaxID=1740262 RepID=A0ABV1RM32_9ALTE|nr:TetR/AcrR family transcriptional regulator [Catenovulum sediminis]